mmetsp:Transcript_39484/g.126566  ORF Transcript_39484/g.126566 Transcript_39484/m.126566 type:complete len:203 (+) Transcript_39484:2520-3128(+)
MPWVASPSDPGEDLAKPPRTSASPASRELEGSVRHRGSAASTEGGASPASCSPQPKLNSFRNLASRGPLAGGLSWQKLSARESHAADGGGTTKESSSHLLPKSRCSSNVRSGVDPDPSEQPDALSTMTSPSFGKVLDNPDKCEGQSDKHVASHACGESVEALDEKKLFSPSGARNDEESSSLSSSSKLRSFSRSFCLRSSRS